MLRAEFTLSTVTFQNGLDIGDLRRVTPNPGYLVERGLRGIDFILHACGRHF